MANTALDNILGRVSQILTPVKQPTNAFEAAKNVALGFGNEATSGIRTIMSAPAQYLKVLPYGAREAQNQANQYLQQQENIANIQKNGGMKTTQFRMAQDIAGGYRDESNKTINTTMSLMPGAGKLATSGVKTILTGAGLGAGTGAVAAGMGLGGGLSAIMAKAGGEDPYAAFGLGAAKGLQYAGVNRITAPIIDPIVHSVGAGRPLMQQLVGRAVAHGALNVGEDAITTYGMEGRGITENEALLSFIIGGIVSPLSKYDPKNSFFEVTNDSISGINKKYVRDQIGRFAKAAGVDPKTVDLKVKEVDNFMNRPMKYTHWVGDERVTEIVPRWKILAQETQVGMSTKPKSIIEEVPGTKVKPQSTVGDTKQRFYEYQNKNLEPINKLGFNEPNLNPSYHQRIEDAGDIGRELSLRGKDADSTYIYQKLNRLKKLFKDADEARYFTQNLDANGNPVNVARQSEIVGKYVDGYKNYPGQLSPLEAKARDLTVATTEKDLPKIKKLIGEFEEMYKLNVAQAPKPQSTVGGVKPNLTQQVAESVTGKKIKVKPDQVVEAPPIKPLSSPLGLPMGTRARYDVSTKNQMKKILAKDPNADVRIVLRPGKGQIKVADGELPTREQVGSTLQGRLDNFIQDTLGYSTKAPEGGTRVASGYTKMMRAGQEKITRAVESGMASENSLIRGAATTLQNFFRGLGMSPERANASMQLRGEISSANDQAFNVMDALYKSLGEDRSSLERINAVLDPGISKTKVKFDDLTPTEKQAYGIIREGLDLVHDTSYANGHISEELYLKNKGSYTPRAYAPMELPTEVSEFSSGGRKINNKMYKQRKSVNEWRLENSLNDPVYALGRRLSQVETNAAVKKYTDFLANNPNYVSDTPRAGFTQLSESPAYGALSGKYVMNSAAEDLKGFFFANKAVNELYDVFKAYDRLPIRQLQKKLLTVFNPTTNIGNIVSDQVFGFVTGVDPLTLNKNLLDFKNNPAEYKQLSRYLMKQGITSTDITSTDFVNKLGMIDDLAANTKPGKIATIANKVQSFYGGTDDVYKASAFKALLDKGFTLEEATRKVADGFQNYANVGKFYDVWAKTPVVGSAFIKFQGDLMRIIKNGAINNPMGLISFLGTLWGVARLSSKLSGESDEDRKTRENRFAAPMIPGLKIPLTWQTPIGEINVARYISPFYANNETTNVAKMLPFVPDINPDKDIASNIAMNADDPLLSTPVQLLVNRDFRGKPISDPDENKFQPSTLTSGEKLTNQAKFAARSYTPPTINSMIDVGAAAQGKPNMYGTPQTVPQAVARVGGVKISNMTPEEVQKIRANDAQYQQKDNEAMQKQISAVTKQLLSGEISQAQADNRIAAFQKQMTNTNLVGETGSPTTGDYAGKIAKVGNTYKYLDNNGNQQTAPTERAAQIGVEKAAFENSPENFKDLGDVVLRKSSNGNITTMTKDSYDAALGNAKLSNYKKNNNPKLWFETADKQFEIYQRQLQDPQVDELDKIDIQNKIDTLVDQYKKYLSYGGGFSSGKKSSVKMKPADLPKSVKFQMKRPTSAKKSKIKTTRAKKLAPPKIKVSRFK
jgi:hypothetical protein